MAVTRIKTGLPCGINKKWGVVFGGGNYGALGSGLCKNGGVKNRKVFEYNKNGHSTKFTGTLVEPYARWEFEMENSNMTGHWIGVFTERGDETEIDFTECVKAKKWFMKPFVKSYLRKQQAQFVADIRKALGRM